MRPEFLQSTEVTVVEANRMLDRLDALEARNEHELRIIATKIPAGEWTEERADLHHYCVCGWEETGDYQSNYQEHLK